MIKRPSFVYIVEAQNGLIKIGWSYVPHDRAAIISCVSPVLTRLIACWPGTKKDEYRLHRKSDLFRRHNEWFSLEGELLDFVNAVRGTGLPDGVADWPEVTPESRAARDAKARQIASRKMKALWSDPEIRQNWLKSLERGRARAWLIPFPEQAA